jgi:hypothetical protein
MNFFTSLPRLLISSIDLVAVIIVFVTAMIDPTPEEVFSIVQRIHSVAAGIDFLKKRSFGSQNGSFMHGWDRFCP